MDNEEKRKFCLTDISSDDEYWLLSQFSHWVENHFDAYKLLLCAHNGKEFDFPYLCRRMVINEIAIPKVLSLSGKKPWEVRHLDTMEMWKFGDRKQYTALDLLAKILKIPGSKSDIDGSQVHQVYYQQNNIKRISTYCRKDVQVTAGIYSKLAGTDYLKEDDIREVDWPVIETVEQKINHE